MASTSSNQLPNVSESNQETLNYIQELQTLEQNIFTNLEQNGSTMTDAEQNQLIKQMNDISQMRVNLYQTLSGMNSLFQNALVNSRDTLDEQIVAISIVEQQLNDAKEKLTILEEEKNNNIRSIQINDYYAERYSQHAKLMKIIIFMLVPIIIMALLYNYGFLPKPIYFTLVAIVAIIGFYFIWTNLFSMSRRDNMNYQQYNWNFNPKTAPTIDSIPNSPTDPWDNGKGTTECIGAQCCNQYEMFDASLNKCSLLPTTSSSSSNSTSGTSLNAEVKNEFNSLTNDIGNKIGPF
jgi:disulfide bond formation protein DsbB